MNWTLYFCVFAGAILCAVCTGDIAEIHSREELCDRAVQPSPYHNCLGDDTKKSTSESAKPDQTQTPVDS